MSDLRIANNSFGMLQEQTCCDCFGPPFAVTHVGITGGDEISAHTAV
jgi:hypothetical protein